MWKRGLHKRPQHASLSHISLVLLLQAALALPALAVTSGYAADELAAQAVADSLPDPFAPEAGAQPRLSVTYRHTSTCAT